MTTSSTPVFTTDVVMEFIELCKSEESLWKSTDVRHSCRRERREAAERISKKLNIKNFDWIRVLNKFRAIRNNYKQELKKMAELLHFGLEYNPTVYWFDAVDSFLRPYISSGIRIKENRELISILVPPLREQCFRPPTRTENANSSGSIESSRKHGCPDTEKWQDKAKRPRTDKFSDKLSEISKDLRNSRRENDFDDYGKQVACLLKELPLTKALLLQSQIVNSIIAVAVQDM